MALTPTTKRLLREAGSWAVAAVIIVAAVSHYETLKNGAVRLLGVPEHDKVAHSGDHSLQTQAALPYSPIVELEAGRHGHFRTEAEINGRQIPVMVDTGATMVSLSYEDAERAGLYLNRSDFTHKVNTANGVARVAPVTLDRVSIGDITVRDVQATVAEPGRLNMSLLGMSFLGRLSRFDMRAGMLVLQE